MEPKVDLVGGTPTLKPPTSAPWTGPWTRVLSTDHILEQRRVKDPTPGLTTVIRETVTKSPVVGTPGPGLRPRSETGVPKKGASRT